MKSESMVGARRKIGWLAAIRAIFHFRGAPAGPRATSERNRTPKRGGSPVQRRLTLVQKLASQGIDTPEIARQTGLSQDIVSMLLHLRPTDSADSSGQGRFFRILQARIAA